MTRVFGRRSRSPAPAAAVREAAVAGLPPAVDADLHVPALSEYFRARVVQHTRDSYAGVPLSKFPEDLRVYEHLLWLDRSDTVVELGTQYGGSALWLRDRLRAMAGYGRIGAEPRVVSVDLSHDGAREATDGLDTTGITWVDGRLEDQATVARVTELVAGGRVLVIEDSAHTYETTAAALAGYAPLVPPGGFMVVEDGCVDDEHLRLDGWPRGVRPALDAWLATDAGAAFTVRRDLELYGVTCHPGGFLQRVR